MTDIAPSSPAVPRVCGGLKPVDPDLSPEVRVWVQELRTLWAAVGMSVNRFAHLNHIDKGAVSRYLNGKRVPGDRWFLDRLLAIQAEKSKEVSQQVREHLTRLQLEALQAAHPHEYRVRLVRDELQIAVVGRREAERYAAGLEERLADRNRQLEELTDRHGRLRAAWDADRAAVRAGKECLDAEIADLVRQLEHARRRAAIAEQRCQELERLLDQLEGPSLPSPADLLPDAYFASPDAAVTLLEAMGKVEAKEQVRLLAERAATDCPLTSPGQVTSLLEAMGHRGAEEQMLVLAKRAATDCPLTYPGDVAKLLAAMRELGVELMLVLAERAATNYSLTAPSQVTIVLEAMKRVGAQEQVQALAERTAADCPLTTPGEMAIVLEAMGRVGTEEQARVLAGRAATDCPLSWPGDVAKLLEAMGQVGAQEQARLLAGRAATDCRLTNDFDVASLLEAMGQVGAEEHARMLAGRAATDCHIYPGDATRLLKAMKLVGAEEQARVLTKRVSTGRRGPAL